MNIKIALTVDLNGILLVNVRNHSHSQWYWKAVVQRRDREITFIIRQGFAESLNKENVETPKAFTLIHDMIYFQIVPNK